jgi:3'-phosphoadenosine 5'-phosphosulfate sulfotransferase (PAPS reductase)/FAD synthetase
MAKASRAEVVARAEPADLSALENALQAMEQAADKHKVCAVAYSGGKDSTAVLDMASRFWSKPKAFMLQTFPGSKCYDKAIEQAHARYRVDVMTMQHPVVGDWLRGQVFCDSGHRHDALPRVTLVEAYSVAMRRLGASCVLVGSKSADGIFRRRSLKKDANQAPWLIYPIVTWRSAHVWSYLASRKLTAPLTSKDRTAFEVDLTPQGVLWFHDNWPEDFERMRALFPYVDAVVKRREFYAAEA